ncbi:hypothetical protein EIK77_006031 [Talaromyces pinophilus]|nr:hypothetical protein EIK77_006031 [Talaromyces pinophilus]
MERYLLENTEPYKLLVQRFKPPHRKVAERIQKGINPTTSVVARIRPILDEEVSSGQVVAAFPRDGEDDTVDVHELLRVIRGLPAINVREDFEDRVSREDRYPPRIDLVPWLLE